MEKNLSLKNLLEEDNKIFNHNKHVSKYEPMLDNLKSTKLSIEEKKSALVVYDCLLSNVFSSRETVENLADAEILVAVMKFYEQFDDVKVPEYNKIASDDGQFRNVKSFLRKQLDFENISEHATSEYNTSKNIGEHLKYRLDISNEGEINSIMANIEKYIIKKPTFKNTSYQIPKELADMLMKTCSECAKEDKNVPDCKDLATNENQFWAVRKWFGQKFCCIRKINEIAKRDLANNIYRSMFVPRKLNELNKPDKKPNKINKVNENKMSEPLKLSKKVLDSYNPDAIEDVLKYDGRQYANEYSLSEIINASDFGDMSINEIETIIRHNLVFSSVCKTGFPGKYAIEQDTAKLFSDIETRLADLVSKNPKMILKFHYELVSDIMALSKKFDFERWANDLSIPVYENANIDNQDFDYINKVRSFEHLYTDPYIPKYNLVYKFLLSRMDDKNNLINQDALSLIPKECTDILVKANIPACMKEIFKTLDDFSELKTANTNNMDDLVDNLNTVINFMYENKIITGQKPDLLNNNSFDVTVIDKICEFFRVIVFGFNFSKLFYNEYSIENSAKLAKFESYLKMQFSGSNDSKVSPLKFLNAAKQIISQQESEENNINEINIE